MDNVPAYNYTAKMLCNNFVLIGLAAPERLQHMLHRVVGFTVAYPSLHWELDGLTCIVNQSIREPLLLLFKPTGDEEHVFLHYCPPSNRAFQRQH